MHRFSAAHRFLYGIANDSRSDLYKLIALLVCFPTFKLSHASFKLAYRLNQIRLRRLCGENFFLQFYDRPVAEGSITDITQSLRHIKRGLDGAESSKYLRDHVISPTAFGLDSSQ